MPFRDSLGDFIIPFHTENRLEIIRVTGLLALCQHRRYIRLSCSTVNPAFAMASPSSCQPAEEVH